jgi:hypothetical protein
MHRLPATLLLLSTASGLGATTALPLADSALRSQAAVVAELSVLSVSSAPGSPIPSTDHIALVERILKGRLPGTTIVVRLPGGLGGDGIGLRVDGLPPLAAGDRVVAFLEPRDDGTYGVVHLGSGLFLAVEAGRGHWAIPLAGAAPDEETPMRDLERWTAWLEEPERRAWESTLGQPSSAVLRKASTLREALAAREDVATAEAIPSAAARWSIDHRLPPSVFTAWRLALAGTSQGPSSVAPAPPASALALPGPGSWLAADGAHVIPGRFDCTDGGLAVLSATRYRVQSTVASGRAADRTAEPLGRTLLLHDGAACLAEGDSGALARILADELASSGPGRAEPSRDP